MALHVSILVGHAFLLHHWLKKESTVNILDGQSSTTHQLHFHVNMRGNDIN